LIEIFCFVGGEWDYVIFSLVRSLPKYLIEKDATEGWCIQNLGFITDIHQINVALTRAKKGLIIIGMILFSIMLVNKVKPAHAVTSIKQSPVLKGHIFLVLSLKISFE
jgi:superfamily I DNA and/or RNA helicase